MLRFKDHDTAEASISTFLAVKLQHYAGTVHAYLIEAEALDCFPLGSTVE